CALSVGLTHRYAEVSVGPGLGCSVGGLWAAVAVSLLTVSLANVGLGPHGPTIGSGVKDRPASGSPRSEEGHLCELLGEGGLRAIRRMQVELEGLRRVFQWIDTKKDGVLDFEEVLSAFYRVGYRPSKADVEQYIWEVDDDLDGTVSWDELLV
ncbi:hypothetical protein FOZ63_022014, partial [Perkinsus olseni]